MSGYTLYWRRGSGSVVIEAALRMIGADFNCVEMQDSAMCQTPEFLALNPAGKVPVLACPSGPVIAESAAILLVLDDLLPEARLLPPHGTPGRSKAVQWLIFMSANIYTADLRYYYPERHTTDTSPAAAAAIKRQSALDMDRDFAQIASAIEGPFLLGETMTITDVYAAMLADWHAPAMQLPEIATLVAHVLENEAVRTAWENQGFGG
ncbi:Glutathione S-transferase [Hoeflea phototrophica DFL-43]|jgi:glutathione S-transferase|uniref:Glutathione S-transferase n=1 Tax=Hoeflea phototrophica (strain DSM 17068 / NCIMB 14078 / DFL-43) TaxID=411684 RepID=A9DE78_HOEPD|nr:glutathione S-transferase family protein [Hoeflea phototrophica]EDQ31980.1 Glutathione S-transferase [Hoeflea phototrophica DFL-43]